MDIFYFFLKFGIIYLVIYVKKTFIFAGLVLIIDQMIKWIITQKLYVGQSITIIPSFFRITYVRNEGAAWSLFSGNQIFLLLVTVIAVVLIYQLFLKNAKLSKIEQMIYGSLLGGIFGNFIDRLLRGFVIDFLDFNIGSYNYPIFNFADIMIVISVLFMIIIGIKEGKHGNNKACRG